MYHKPSIQDKYAPRLFLLLAKSKEIKKKYSNSYDKTNN